MAANPIKRYFWLVDTIHRYAPISFKEVAERWRQSALYDHKELAIRTFHNHRAAVEELFHIHIACDERTNMYHIANQSELARNGLSSWLLNVFSMSNILAESQSLGSRVQVEDIPSAQHHLTTLLVAMRENRCVKVIYQPFVAEAPFELVLQPLFVKLYDRRWYLYANKPNDEKIKLYALDRMHALEVQEERFVYPANFDPDTYTHNAFGVAIYNEIPPCTIRIRVRAGLAAYLRTLPLHHSQREVETTNRYADFAYFVAPTQEFYLKLMSYGWQIEVLSPEKVRTSIHWRLMQAAVIYDKEVHHGDDDK